MDYKERINEELISCFYAKMGTKRVTTVCSWTTSIRIDMLSKKIIPVNTVNKSLHCSLCVVLHPWSVT
jgi:hypothetical protein